MGYLQHGAFYVDASRSVDRNDLTAIDIMLRASEMAFGSLVPLSSWI